MRTNQLAKGISRWRSRAHDQLEVLWQDSELSQLEGDWTTVCLSFWFLITASGTRLQQLNVPIGCEGQRWRCGMTQCLTELAKDNQEQRENIFFTKRSPQLCSSFWFWCACRLIPIKLPLLTFSKVIHKAASNSVAAPMQNLLRSRETCSLPYSTLLCCIQGCWAAGAQPAVRRRGYTLVRPPVYCRIAWKDLLPSPLQII